MAGDPVIGDPVTGGATSGDAVEVTIDKVVAGGAGLGRMADGRAVFVAATLPGEQVRVRVTSTKKDFARAEVVEVVVPSPDRVVAACPMVAAGCGGCDWQHVEPAAQLRLKGEIVADALARTAKLRDAGVALGGAVSPWGYRTTLRTATQRGRLGLRAAASHEVVVLDRCPVSVDRLSALLPAVRLRGDGAEVILRVSATTGEATVRTVPGGVPVETPAGVRGGADATLVERVEGHELRVGAGSFFQSGVQAAELLVRTVSEVLGADARRPAVDLYGGIGLFAVCSLRGPVTVVESSGSACADARHNLVGREATVARCTVERWRPHPAEVVVADPARAGLGAPGAAAIAATAAERVVLVSCDPVSLARDTRLLADHGYRHRRSIVLDLFPQTSHVEVVTEFSR